jgi:site-specific recombinase XerD
MPNMNLQSALGDWLEIIRQNKSPNTYRTSLAASRSLLSVIGDVPLDKLDEEQYSIFLSRLKRHSPATEKLYATIIYLFFEYLAAKELRSFNMAAMKYTRKTETRKIGENLREIDKEQLAVFQGFVLKFDPAGDLQLSRAKAWITLAFESGLRAFELCGLRRNNINLPKCYGTVTGKGDKKAKFYFTDASVQAIGDYLKLRNDQEPKRGANVPADNRPLFVSHSRRRSRSLSPITTETARADLSRMLVLCFGEERNITPHVLRHFFVHSFLEEYKNPELARKAARHKNIATTQRYLHVDDEEVQSAHRKIFSKGETR